MSENENTVVHYSHNNSGGRDWMDADSWAALVTRGWVLDSFNGSIYGADRTGLSMDEAVAEWTIATGQDPNVDGCECCGPPHSFYSH